jgi:hypothetical protein
MGRLRLNGVSLLLAIFSLWALAGCGSGAKAGPPLFAGHINLTPTTTSSLVLGGSITFIASAQTASGTNLAVPITYSSSDTSILNLAPNGVACAGHWDANFTACTPGNVGVVQVTASALGATSVPTYVFVHQPIDNITVSGVLLDGVPVQEPCLSQNQTMTVEAHAFSQGTDITSSVGPFVWIASNPPVVSMVGIPNTAYNFPTNQATARAGIPGISNIMATAGGVTSRSFQQPQYTVGSTTSPVLDFFATCPVQNISLEVGAAGSGQTSFSTSSSTAQNIVATVTDVMGNSSLPNTNGGVVLSKIPLTWTSSHPGVISVASTCSQSCTATPAGAGAASITASCTPPSCNLGFPTAPASLSTAAQITTCTDFFKSTTPPGFSCAQLIPMPVYASPVFIPDPKNPGSDIPLQPPTGAISGVVSATTGAASVFASSTGCSSQPPNSCNTSAYFLSTAKATPNSENPLPTSPNSFLYVLGGDRVYMGSNFGAQIISPANFGTANSPYTSLGTITGKVLAASYNGAFAAFSDTVHTPNQVYIVNASSSSSTSATALTIPGATSAAFSPDGLKTFIAATGGTSLYVYSLQQAIQGPIALTGSANAIAFAPNGGFAFVAEAAPAGGGSANLTAFATCNNLPAATLPLPANPILMRVLPNAHIDGKDSYGNSIPDGIHVLIMDATGLDIITATISAPPAGTLCPEGLAFISNDPARVAQRIELGQGTLQPVNFFVSGDGTQIYVANASSSTILIYNFIVGSVIGGIELANNATPETANMSSDGGTIIIAGSDNMLHEVSTSLGGSDLVQLSFPNLPNYLNPFCTTDSASQCTLNVAITRP